MPGKAEIGEGLTRTHKLLNALNEDVVTSYKLLDQDRESQFMRRCAVRSVYSYVEACIECIKVELRSSIRLGEFTDELSGNENETLGSVAVVASRDGKFLPLEKNIKRTFKLASKVWGLTFELDVSSEDAMCFEPSKMARNRLTHPYTFYDIEVSDADMGLHTATYMWIQREFVRLFKARVEALLSDAPEGDKQALQNLLAWNLGTDEGSIPSASIN